MLGCTKILMLSAQIVAIATSTPVLSNNVKRDIWPGCLNPHPTPTPTCPKASVTNPSPVRSPMAPNCNKFCWVPPGSWCDPVAKNNGITAEQLTTWNPYVGPKCTGLWADYYACIGVSDEAKSA
ncbi:hypothetical protein J3459_017640 [Metarhizium acridum]|uniref:uncharacterized protein n=1 Tax=Metarhizium acridum TaxID=92637 RepID=UPI001C6D07D6|nr:hypothetical protein J3459_017640 [Metarhizium acridum]KAG8411095.1 hypothetical protein J3458_016205 [Metarhizium acridum]